MSLAIKRIAKIAVDEGYDRVAFPDGDVVADRSGFDADAPERHGTRTFYNRIVPGLVKELTRKLGGEAFEPIQINTRSRYQLSVDEGKSESQDYSPSIYGIQDRDNGKYVSWISTDGSLGWSDRPVRLFSKLSEAQAQLKRMGSVDMPDTMTVSGFDITPAIREKVSEGLPLFSRKSQSDPSEVKYDGPGKDLINVSKNFISNVIGEIADSGVGKAIKAAGRESAMAVTPMSAGSQRAKAAAQRFANQERASRYKWQQMADLIEKSYTPKEREAMWDAADEQNDLLRENWNHQPGKGLDRLPADQRAVVEEMHKFSNQLWRRAVEAGLVKGEAVPFWTPRMMVMLGEDGTFSKIGAHGTAPNVDVGSNINVKAINLLTREYDTAAETEAAAKAMYGESAHIVRDILTMPLAMARVERAVASRELINQIQEIGKLTGKELVGTDADKTKFFTLPHPAFRTYGPKFDLEGSPVKNADGGVVMEQKPIYVAKEFEGPLKAVMAKTDGVIYSGMMLLKSKAMSALMFSPLTHNMVIYGRAVGYSPLKVGTGYMYFRGHQLVKDTKLMRQAILDGMVPIGANRNSMIDVTDIAGNVKQLGKWGDPNESWISLAAQKTGNFLHAGWGDLAKSGMDQVGDVVHHTMLWKQVGALQAAIYKNEFDYRVTQGMSDEAAGAIAAHQANRFAGAMANENMSEYARKTANLALFSRSFTLGNVGALKDVLTGLPAGLQAKLMEDIGSSEGKKAIALARTQAGANFLKDTAFMLVMTAAVQSAIDKWKLGRSNDEIARGYADRWSNWKSEMGHNPINVLRPDHLLPTHDNEPGKEERINMGMQPNGRNEYMRLPFGKVPEDWIGWMTQPDKILRNKLSPMLKGLWEASRNEDVFGHPVRDPQAAPFLKLAQWLEVVTEAQMPVDSAKRAYHAVKGDATDLDKLKLMGELTGFSIGQGYPGGPEAAVAADVNRKFQEEKQYILKDALEALKYGHTDEAIRIMQDAKMTPDEINAAILKAMNPKRGMTDGEITRFNKRANAEDQRRLETVNR